MRNAALIDGDMLLYLAGFTSQQKVYIVNGTEYTTKGAAISAASLLGEDVEILEKINVFPLDSAIHVIEDILTTTIRNTACSEVLVFLSGPNEICFRSEIATIRPYKGNRASSERPVHYSAIKAYLISKYNADICYWHEADDALSMLADGNIMCTADKDLLQVPGIHYNFYKHEHREISYLEGEYNLFHQILTGDNVDNIQGLPGIGVARATEALEEHKNDPSAMYDTVLNMYIDRWPADHQLTGEGAFHETAQLVYMLRSYEDNWFKRSLTYQK